MKTPKYVTIANSLRKEIADGTFESGLLPIEKKLCETFDVSKITIKKAVDILVAEGLVMKKQGSGTYINTSSLQLTKEEDNLASEGTSKLFGYALTHPGHIVDIDVRTFEIIKSPKEIAGHLAINEGDFIYEVIRVRSENDIPFVCEHTYMPIDLIPGINMEVLNHSVYSYIIETLNKKIDSSHEFIYADKATKMDVELLKIEKTEPVTVLEQIVFLDNGVPFQYSVTRYRYDRFKYKGISKIDI